MNYFLTTNSEFTVNVTNYLVPGFNTHVFLDVYSNYDEDVSRLYGNIGKSYRGL